jgi:hypothetical protein
VRYDNKNFSGVENKSLSVCAVFQRAFKTQFNGTEMIVEVLQPGIVISECIAKKDGEKRVCTIVLPVITFSENVIYVRGKDVTGFFVKNHSCTFYYIS